MKMLVACEFSGVVREAFRRHGWDAWSCDLLDTEQSGQHIVGDVLQVLDQGWDLMVAHPPCTYLCGMGVWWNHKRPERWAETDKALEFFRQVYEAPIPCRCIENPVGIVSTRIRKPDQIIQPWQYGHEANKPTCLWLVGLPTLTPTNIVSKGEFYVKKNGARMSKWSHSISGTNKAMRARNASRTFPGIAEAMASQWTEAFKAKQPPDRP